MRTRDHAHKRTAAAVAPGLPSQHRHRYGYAHLPRPHELTIAPPPPPILRLPQAYTELGLRSGARATDVRKAYRARVLHDHPDKTGGITSARFMRAQRAYETIMEARKPAADGPSIVNMAEKMRSRSSGTGGTSKGGSGSKGGGGGGRARARSKAR